MSGMQQHEASMRDRRDVRLLYSYGNQVTSIEHDLSSEYPR